MTDVMEPQGQQGDKIELHRPFYTVPDIAYILNVEERTVRTYLKTNQLKGGKFNGMWRIRRDDLQAFINERFG